MLEAIIARNPAEKTYVEDVFSTYLYNGTGQINNIETNLAMVNTAEWNIFTLLNGNTTARASAVDSSGNLYIAGNVTVSSLTYGLVVKYDSTGTILWQKYLYQNTTQFNAIDVDSSGNVYVGGQAQDATSVYMLIAKYDSSGTLQWATKYRQNYSYCYGLKVDSSANIYVCGEANDGTRRYISTLKLNTNGAITWQRYAFQNIASTGYGVAVDSSGNVASIGYSLDAGSNYYGAVLYYNSSGTLQWTKSVSTAGLSGSGITFDSSGNLYFVSSSSIYKFNSAGTLQWQKVITSNFTATNTLQLYAISIDSSSNIYVTGSEKSGSYDQMYIASLDSSGNLLWQRNVSNSPYTYYTYGYGIALNSSGTLCIAGQSTNGTNNYAVTLKIKTDGTTKSGKALLLMYNGSATVSTGSATVSTPGLTTGTSSITTGSGGIVEATVTPTTASYKQSEVTNSGGGGLVWIKSRSGATDHALYDTIRGVTSDLVTNSTAAQTTQSTGLVSFNTNGFSIGSLAKLNTNASTYAAWNFKKQAKFFDVVTWTGNDSTQTISHSLGVEPGMIIAKRTSTTGSWRVYHRSASTQYGNLDSTSAFQTTNAQNVWGNNSTTVAPTSATFTVGNDSSLNSSGHTYVAYLFAHDAGVDSMVNCGSYTGTASSDNFVNLGWEPQFVMIKQLDSAGLGTGNWYMFDNMRGIASGGNDPTLYSNSSATELTTADFISADPLGFLITQVGTSVNGAGIKYIYLAIRRGPMRTPTDATKNFNTTLYTGNNTNNRDISGSFPPDMVLTMDRNKVNLSASNYFNTRLTNAYLTTNTIDKEFSGGQSDLSFNSIQNGFRILTPGYTNYLDTMVAHQFKRAPGFFDIVCYVGTSVARTVNHKLGVTPELMIVKGRDLNVDGFWAVYSQATGPTNVLQLQSTAASTSTTWWNNTAPTATTFSVDGSLTVNYFTGNYIAYLFSTCPGVSKVGSYTGNGTSQNIDCGFTNGARFILIKRTNSTGNWYVWDTARGIVAANDPNLSLNSTAAEVTTDDSIDPLSTGFIVRQVIATNVNVNAASYIYLAIA